jgi:hypothetical protein
MFLPLISRVSCLSYDRTLTIFNSYSGILETTVTNPNNCDFSAMLYDSQHNQLLLVDISGYLHIYSFEKSTIICMKRLVQDPILDILRLDNTTFYAFVLKVSSRLSPWAWILGLQDDGIQACHHCCRRC